MSIIQPATVQAIALSVNVNHLTDEAAKVLAPDVENRLREVIQDALKFARHSKRTKLTTQDINSALRMRNVEPLYGFLNNADPAKYVRATGHPDVYFVRDSMVPLEQITCAPLPRAPPATTVMPHWLFIDGVQPATEENAAVERPPQQPAKRPRLNSQQPAGAAAAQNGTVAAPGRRKEANGVAAAAAASPATGVAAGAAATDGAVVAGGAGSGAGGGGGGGERVALPVQHILSEEMQRLLEQVKQVLGAPQPPPPAAGGSGEALWGGVDEGGGASAAASAAPLVLSPLQRAMLTMVQTDPGMQQLLPYLVQHIAAEVAGALRHLPRLHMVLRITQALLLNPAVQLEPYLASLMPPLLTCLMAKSLGPSPAADHWSLRDAAASLLARLCGRFGEPYYSLQVKVSKQLLRALLDGSKPLPSHYGAVAGLAALGHSTVRLLLLPQLEPYLAALRPALGGEEAREAEPAAAGKREREKEGAAAGAGTSGSGVGKEREGVVRRAREGLRQFEARRVYGALAAAAAGAVYDRLLAAAADGLPLQLFRAAGRFRGSLLALKDAPSKATAQGAAPTTTAASLQTAPSAASAIIAPAAQAPAAAASTSVPPLPSFTPVPPPPHDPRLDAIWDQTQSKNSNIRLTVDGIIANPAAHASICHLVKFSNIAVDPTQKLYDLAKAILHQLAKRGIGPPPLGTPMPPPLPPPPVAAPAAEAAPGSGQAAPATGDSVDAEQQKAPKRVDAALQAGPPAGRGAALRVGEPGRGPREILAESWREDADLGETVWALGELLGPAFTARLPQPALLAGMSI